MDRRFLLNKQDAKFMGVAAGLGDLFKVDPLLVRLGIVAAVMLTGPIALVLYLAAGILADQR